MEPQDTPFFLFSVPFPFDFFTTLFTFFPTSERRPNLNTLYTCLLTPFLISLLISEPQATTFTMVVLASSLHSCLPFPNIDQHSKPSLPPFRCPVDVLQPRSQHSTSSASSTGQFSHACFSRTPLMWPLGPPPVHTPPGRAPINLLFQRRIINLSRFFLPVAFDPFPPPTSFPYVLPPQPSKDSPFEDSPPGPPRKSSKISTPCLWRGPQGTHA